jgi:PPOX class probable F420-dependent enzyme
MAGEAELWELVAAGREGTLATIGISGRPQLSNVLYLVDGPSRVVRVSTTADRVKSRNLARDPRASLHVAGDDFWHFAVAECSATLSAVASTPDDDAIRELRLVHGGFYGELPDAQTFAEQMIAAQRLVIRLQVDHLYGVMATGGRRPRALPADDQRT